MRANKTPISKNLTKRFANEKYRLACEEPYLWMCKAREIQRAADLLWDKFVEEVRAFSNGEDMPEPFFGAVALMLYGLVVENFLKAGLASIGALSTPNGNFGQKSHDLEKLAAHLKVNLSAEEAEFLERLQGFIEWAGRYPIPLLAQGLYPRVLRDGGQGSLFSISTTDGPTAVDLITRLQRLLPSEEEAIQGYAKNKSAQAGQ